MVAKVRPKRDQMLPCSPHQNGKGETQANANLGGYQSMSDVAVLPTSGGLLLVDVTAVLSMLTHWTESDGQQRGRVATMIA